MLRYLKKIVIPNSWLILVGISMLSFGAVAVLLVLIGFRSPVNARMDLSRLRLAVETDFLEADNRSIKIADAEITNLTEELRFPLIAANWASKLAISVSWAPILYLEGLGLNGQGKRIEADLVAAEKITNWAKEFRSEYSKNETALLGGLEGDRLVHLRYQLDQWQLLLSDSESLIDAPSLRTRWFTINEQFGPIAAMLGQLSRMEIDMTEATKTGQTSILLISALLDLAQTADAMSSFFHSGKSDQTKFDDKFIYSTLSEFNLQAAAAKNFAFKASVELKGLGDSGLQVQRLSTLEEMLGELQAIGEAILQGFDALKPATEILNGMQGGLLDSDGRLLEALWAINQNLEELLNVTSQLSKSQTKVLKLQSENDWLKQSNGVSEILNLVSEVERGLLLLRAFVPVALPLMNSDEPRKYLVLGQSSDELRGTGGFVSAIWTLKFQNDRFTDVSYYDVVRVDDWDRLELYSKAPKGLEEHMNMWVWLLRDVSWDPDFKATGKTAKAMFQIGQNQDVDGVVAINQWAILELIKAIGPIPPPDGGVAITANNVITVLEEATDLYGRAYLDLVLQGILERLKSPTSLPDLIQVTSAMHRALESRDLLIFFDDPHLQAVINREGWSGEIEETKGDYLYVVDSNVGWSKVDRNIERNVSYLVDLSKFGRPRATLEVEYVNHSSPGSSPCEPQWQNRGENYHQISNACYWNFTRVYLPIRSNLLHKTPLPLPKSSVSAEIGIGKTGQDTGLLSVSHDKLVFSGLISIEAVESRKFVLVYDLPKDTVVYGMDNLVYNLTIQKQPGVRQKKISIELIPPDGYMPTTSSLPYTIQDSGSVNISKILKRDEYLQITFVKEPRQNE